MFGTGTYFAAMFGTGTYFGTGDVRDRHLFRDLFMFRDISMFQDRHVFRYFDVSGQARISMGTYSMRIRCAASHDRDRGLDRMTVDAPKGASSDERHFVTSSRS